MYMHLIIDADFHQITLRLGIESRSAIDPLHHIHGQAGNHFLPLVTSAEPDCAILAWLRSPPNPPNMFIDLESRWRNWSRTQGHIH